MSSELARSELLPRTPAAQEAAHLWSSAVAVAWLGTQLLYGVRAGINWGIWTLVAAAGLVWFARTARGRLSRPMLAPLALAVSLGAGVAVTANAFFQFLSILAAASLLALATMVAVDEDWSRVDLGRMIWCPLVAPVWATQESMRRAAEAASLLSARRSAPAVRGVLLAIPTVVGFGILLAEADPVFASLRAGIVAALTSWGLLPRLLFFATVLVLVSGAYGIVLGGRVIAQTQRVEPSGMRTGGTERLIVLASVASLFGVFLVLQLTYLFGNAPAAPGSGVTFAEFARRGFGELTMAATLCTVLILVLARRALPGEREGRIHALQLALIGELVLLLVSAFRRVLLYEAAYGYTAARVHAQAYMVVVALVLLTLAREVSAGLDLARLARRGAVMATCALVALVYWNHEAWIAARNLERYQATGKLDVAYLATLSPDALPTLVASLPRLQPADAARLRACIDLRGGAVVETGRWFEWNVRRAGAARAAAAAGITPGSSSITATGQPRQRHAC